jgi:Flp pilus assembly CpaE family ATPase
MGVIEDSSRYASAIVTSEAAILTVRKSDFDEVMSVNPSIAMKIMVTVTRRYKSNIEAGSEPVQAPAAVSSAAKDCKIIVVHSSTGGAGTSTVVCNLAYCLSRSGKKVLLLDGSTQFGDLSVLLDVLPKQTLYHMAEEEEFCYEVISNNYINSTKFGFDFIAAPLKPEQFELVSADLFRILLDIVSPEYDFIIIDTYHLMQEPILTLMEVAHEIAYVMTADLPSLKNARLWLGLLRELAFTDAQVGVLLNKVLQTSVVDAESVLKNLDVTILGEIPYDYKSCINCVNKGELVASYANEPIAKALMDVAFKFDPSLNQSASSEDSSSRLGWVGRLTSRFTKG